MTQRLILYIDESWPSEPAAPWVLLDPHDRIVQEGRSESAHWPAAGACELVLGGAQCSWFEARIPKAVRRDQERLLRYALETQLVKDVEAQHLAPTHQRPDGDGIVAGVLVAGRSRLRAVLAQLAAIGRAPVRAIAELQVVPQVESRWTLALGPTGGGILRLDANHAFVVDLPAITDVIDHAIAQARADGSEPAALELRQAPAGAGDVDLVSLHTATGIAVDAGPVYRWWETRAAGTDLLRGEFAPQHRGRAERRALRRPLLVAAAALGVFLVANLAAVLSQRHQLDAVDARMRRLFMTAVPDTPAIAPALQLRRHLDDARGQHGELREDDLLALLSAYTNIRGASAASSIRTLDYDAGRLTLTLDPASASEIPTLEKRFRALGFVAESRSGAMPTLTLSRNKRP